MTDDEPAPDENDRTQEAEPNENESPEEFIRFKNTMYQLVSFVGAGVVAVLGITGFVIGKTLSPTPPPGYFIVDSVLTILVFVWYILGIRCRLDLGDTWVHVATKYVDTRFERSWITAIEPDNSVWGALQWSGRPLIIHFAHDGKSGTRRAYGCLPNDRSGQAAAVDELQRALGSPETIARDELKSALDERLAMMKPEGDDTAALNHTRFNGEP